jgi:hypothetical protein
MAGASVPPLTVTKMDDWSRIYLFDFTDSFVEFSGSSPASITGTPTVTADSGITATYSGLSALGARVRISGGTAGESYNVSVNVLLSTGDHLSIPAIVNVVEPGPGGISQRTLAKLPGWERHYQFPFGRVFSEFNIASPPAITGTPTFACQPAADGSQLSGTPVASGTSAIVFITGGNPGQSYQVRCTVNTVAGDTFSIPGIIQD